MTSIAEGTGSVSPATKTIRIVHVSNSPLVAAPSKIAAATSRIGASALAIAHSDYPDPLTSLFSRGYLIWKDALPEMKAVATRRLAEADIIHVHNELPQDFADWILRQAPAATYLYHVHSPLRESPLYVERSAALGIPFSMSLVVGQGWPRLWPDYRPVPNIIDAHPTIRPRDTNERLRVLYRPSHTRPGRWGGKGCPER